MSNRSLFTLPNFLSLFPVGPIIVRHVLIKIAQIQSVTRADIRLGELFKKYHLFLRVINQNKIAKVPGNACCMSSSLVLLLSSCDSGGKIPQVCKKEQRRVTYMDRKKKSSSNLHSNTHFHRVQTFSSINLIFNYSRII